MSLLDHWMGFVEDQAVVADDAAASGTEFRAGTRLAGSGAVTDLEVTPGLIEASVDHRQSMRVRIGIAPLGETFWAELGEKINANPSWRIQLDAHFVPSELAAELVPDSVVLTPSCRCDTGPRWCRHAVATAAAFGESLNTDPFGIVTALGSSRDNILGSSANEVAMPYGLDVGVSAPAAYRKTRTEAPRVPPVAPSYRAPSNLGVPAPAGSGVPSQHLLDAIDDASRRAHAFLSGADTELYLTIPVGLDVIRRAASGDPAAISAETKLDRSELEAAASAWRVGGAPAVRALRDRWDCPVDQLEAAVSYLGEGDLGERAKVRANTVSTADMQLRLDRQRRWWRLDRHDEMGWMIVAGPAATVADLMVLPVSDAAMKSPAANTGASTAEDAVELNQ